MELRSDVISQYLKSFDVPHSSCWFRTAQFDKIEVPLINMDYKINITNNFCTINLKQKFVNPLNHSVNIHFSYPIDTNFCLGKLSATFKDYMVKGIIEERETANQKYEYLR